MLKRKAYERMMKWHGAPTRKALLVTGARQVGKTFLVREFAKANYEKVLEINLIEDPDACSVFDRARNASDILMRLSLLADEPLVPGKTVVFIDEVQECEDIITSIKFLVDEGSYDYILSGSLLGVELKDVRSVPTGYLSTIELFPLDFEEFCWAGGVAEDVFGELDRSFASLEPIDGFVHQRMLDLFNRYLIIGGMPDAVVTFLSSNDLTLVRTVQDDIKLLYRRDISKYAERDKLAIKEIYDLIPSELNNPNKRFVLKRLNEHARFRSYQNDFSWLIEADVAIAAYNVDEPCRPLLLSKERNLFKLFYSDVGLLTSSFLKKTSQDILMGERDVNYGSTFENAVAQELVCHGFDLYYYNSKKYGEIDFVVEDKNGTVMLLEVKSGKDYRRHRALDNVLAIENYHLERGYVLGSCNIEEKGLVVYLPIYMISRFLNE